MPSPPSSLQIDDGATLAWAQDPPSEPLSRRKSSHRTSLTFSHPLKDVDSDDVWQRNRGRFGHARTFSSDYDLGINRNDRTHLSRWNSASESLPSLPSLRTKNGSRKVIVHEVQPEDTMAGVALLYGIEVSTLKSHNKLWANDTIHMRKKLYIPLDVCSELLKTEQAILDPDGGKITIIRRLHSNGALTTLQSSSQQNLNHNNVHISASSLSRRSSVDSAISSGTSNSQSSSTNTTPAAITEASIRTLPATHLSYFPPSPSSSTTTPTPSIKQRSRPPPPSLSNIFPDLSSSSVISSNSPSTSSSSPSTPKLSTVVMDTILACVPESLAGSLRARSVRGRRRADWDRAGNANIGSEEEAVEDGITWFKL